MGIKNPQTIRELSKVLNGSGGGKDDVAFGGTSDISNFSKIRETINNLIK